MHQTQARHSAPFALQDAFLLARLRRSVRQLQLDTTLIQVEQRCSFHAALDSSPITQVRSSAQNARLARSHLLLEHPTVPPAGQDLTLKKVPPSVPNAWQGRMQTRLHQYASFVQREDTRAMLGRQNAICARLVTLRRRTVHRVTCAQSAAQGLRHHLQDHAASCAKLASSRQTEDKLHVRLVWRAGSMLRKALRSALSAKLAGLPMKVVLASARSALRVGTALHRA